MADFRVGPVPQQQWPGGASVCWIPAPAWGLHPGCHALGGPRGGLPAGCSRPCSDTSMPWLHVCAPHSSPGSHTRQPAQGEESAHPALMLMSAPTHVTCTAPRAHLQHGTRVTEGIGQACTHSTHSTSYPPACARRDTCVCWHRVHIPVLMHVRHPCCPCVFTQTNTAARG